MGGLPWQDEERRRLLDDYVLGLSGKERPRVLFVPTAVGDNAENTLWAYSAFGERARVSHVSFFPWPPADLRELALAQDVIFVSGGNTANALAIWRTHGFDQILREAWEAGVVLTGWSAGMICWFEASVTDSFGPAARRDARRARLPPRQRLPALRRRERAPAGLHEARRGGLPARAWPPTTALRSASTGPSLQRS